MTFRVELTEAATDDRRGFLGTEDDDNPNNNVKVREFDSEDEARSAIGDEVARDENAAREFAFHIVDEDGDTVETTYYDEVYGRWETFN